LLLTYSPAHENSTGLSDRRIRRLDWALLEMGLDPRTGKEAQTVAFKIGALSALTIRWVGWWRSVGPRQPLKLGHIRHAKTQLREFIKIKHAI